MNDWVVKAYAARLEACEEAAIPLFEWCRSCKVDLVNQSTTKNHTPSRFVKSAFIYFKIQLKFLKHIGNTGLIVLFDSVSNLYFSGSLKWSRIGDLTLEVAITLFDPFVLV
jgi:hypothetical protein